MTDYSPRQLSNALQEQAFAAGFDLFGVTTPQLADGKHLAAYRKWIDQGCYASMDYLAQRCEERESPESIVPNVQSVVMLGMNYNTSSRDNLSNGRIARFALGADYHRVIRPRLRELCQWLKKQVPGSHSRGVVDTAPLLEKAYAAAAGLGTFGKNSTLINEKFGSWIFLAAILTTIELPQTEPLSEASFCEGCDACLKACPTGALVAPYQLDARRCLSYWTIEYQSEQLPEEVPLQQSIFGCDACLDACPRNQNCPTTRVQELQRREELDQFDSKSLGNPSEVSNEELEQQFKHQFGDTSLVRAGLRVLLRNLETARVE